MREILEPITFDKKLFQFRVNLTTREAICKNDKQGQTSKRRDLERDSDNDPQKKRSRVDDACDSTSYMLGSQSVVDSKLSTNHKHPKIKARTNPSISPLLISWENEPEVFQNVF